MSRAANGWIGVFAATVAAAFVLLTDGEYSGQMVVIIFAGGALFGQAVGSRRTFEDRGARG